MNIPPYHPNFNKTAKLIQSSFKQSTGMFRISKNGIGWKNKLGKTSTVLSSEIKSAYFVPVSKKHYLLSITSSKGNNLRFEGFDEEAVEKLKSFGNEYFSKNFEVKQRTTKGWNWGDVKIENSSLFFEVDGNLSMEIPLTEVSQSQVDKNDVSLVFGKEATVGEGSQLIEMRFWVPNVSAEGKKPTAEKLNKKILKNADPYSDVVQGIVLLEQIPVKTPRGKVDIEMFSTSLKLKGSHQTTIPYDNIVRLVSLPTDDEKDCMIIISLDPPLRRGHTNYQHVIIQFPYTDTLEVNLTLTDEQKEKYKGVLEEKMSGIKADVIKQLFRVLTGHKFVKVGKFQSEVGSSAIRCSSKAHEGYLYPMEKNFFFLLTPAIFLHHSQISHIEFARVTSNNQSNRNFDLVIFMKSGGASHIFNNILMDELKNLKEYLKERNLVIRGGAELNESESQETSQGGTTIADIHYESDDDDDDFVEGDDDDDDDDDAEFDGDKDDSIDQVQEVTPEKPKKQKKKVEKPQPEKRKRSVSPSPTTKKPKLEDDEIL